jgi:ribosomal protein S18 acetylase RimI-like enzyme
VTVTVREALPGEYAAIGDLIVAAYADFIEIAEDGGYVAELRDVAGRARDCPIYTAVDEDGTILGGATYVPGPGNPYAEVERDGEAGIRMLAVSPDARRRGIGMLLTVALIERARADGRRGMALMSLPTMTAAHAMYERAGFQREPARDWEYRPGAYLWAFALRFDRA